MINEPEMEWINRNEKTPSHDGKYLICGSQWALNAQLVIGWNYQNVRGIYELD